MAQRIATRSGLLVCSPGIMCFLSFHPGPPLLQALMLTQYSSKLIIPLLTLQHAIRLRLAGNKGYHAYKGGSANARRLEKLSSLIGDARVLFRIWGVLPMIKWVSGGTGSGL